MQSLENSSVITETCTKASRGCEPCRAAASIMARVKHRIIKGAEARKVRGYEVPRAQRSALTAVGDAADIKVVMGTRKKGKESSPRTRVPACQLARAV